MCILRKLHDVQLFMNVCLQLGVTMQIITKLQSLLRTVINDSVTDIYTITQPQTIFTYIYNLNNCFSQRNSSDIGYSV